MKLRVNLIFTLILTLSTFKIYSQKGRNLIGCWQVKTDNNDSKVHWQFEKDSIKYIIISCDKDTREVFNVSVMEGTYKVVGDTIFSKIDFEPSSLNIPFKFQKHNKLVLGDKEVKHTLIRTSVCLRYRKVLTSDGGFYWELIN